MLITILMENTTCNPKLFCEHGLSVYVETHQHRLLSDVGQSLKTIDNALRLGIDLKRIDTVFLSHGHYDHTGGLLDFNSYNAEADKYMSIHAGRAYYHKLPDKMKYIGMNPEIFNLSHLHLVENDLKIDEELSLFSNVTGRKLWPASNRELVKKIGDQYVQDTFDHEQYLVIHENNHYVLISGCAHNGILNILNRFKEIYDCYPDYVLSGFHMRQSTPYTEDDLKNIKETASLLKELPTIFYTGHCTGEIAYNTMKEMMQDQLIAIHTGSIIELK